MKEASRTSRIGPTGHPWLSLAGACLIAAAVGSCLGFLVVGSLKMTLAAVGAFFVALAVLYPRLILYLLVTLIVCLTETTYGVQAGQTGGLAYKVGSYRLNPVHLNLYEILLYCLLAILVARRALGMSRREAPSWITIPCLVTALVFCLQFGRALLSGVPYSDALHPFNAEFVLPAVVALWCSCELLGDSAKRLQLLDLLYVCATGRAVYALVRFAFGSGDAANYYRTIGVKVALWESADHLLFAFLIAVAIAAWVTGRAAGRRLMFWSSGSVLMALTVLLSFRRTGWFGLLATLIVVTVVLLRRSQRSLVLIPGLLAVVAAIVVWSYARFSSGGGIVGRLFPDVASQAGPTRQDEWALAWRAIVHNPVLGDLMARRAASLYTPWTTSIVHNAFLFAWMKLGLAGLLSLMVLAAVCVAYAIRGVRARGAEEHIALGVVGLVPFTLLLAMFEIPLIEFRTMFILALVGSLAVRVATALDEPLEASERSSGSGRPSARIE